MAAVKMPKESARTSTANEIDFVRFGHQIRARRESKGWSLTDLAEKSGVSKPFISKLENGEGGRPNIEFVFWIAGALSVTIEELLEPALQPIGKRSSKQKTKIPSGLRELQSEYGLSDEEASTLAELRVGGRAPRNKEQWRLLLARVRSLTGSTPGAA